MPSGGEPNSKTKVPTERERRSQQRASGLAAQGVVADPVILGIGELANGGYSEATFQRHAALLGDGRLAKTANAGQRALIVQRLQRDYGNRYVQRLVKHVTEVKASETNPKTLNSSIAPTVEEAVRGGEGQQTSLGVADQISRLRDPAQYSDPTNPNIDAVSEYGQAHWAIPSGGRGRNINLAPAPTTTKDETEPEVAPEVLEEQSATATQAPFNAPPASQEEQSAQAPSTTATQSEPGAEVGDQTAPSSEMDSASNQGPGAPAPGEQAGVASDGAATATSDGATTEVPGSPGAAASPASGSALATADAGSQPGAEEAPPEEEGAGGGAQEPGMAGPAGGETPPEGGDGAVGESGMVGGGGSAGTPEEDPSFQAMVGKTKSVSTQQQGHPPAEVASSAAQSAAIAPPTEVASKAQANQVGEMEQQPSGTFDKAAFKAALMQKIADMAPKNLEEADEFKGSGKLASVKSDLTTKVDQGKEQSQGPLEEKAAESPDTGAIEPKPVTPLQPQEPGAAPPEVGAAQAMPKPKPQEEVAAPFKQGSQELDQQMAEGEISEAQLANSNEPQFQEALQAKKGAQADAAKAPGQYRQGEQDVLAQAQADAAATAQTETSAMHGDRATLLTEVAGDQGQAKSQDEQARAEVASHIQGIYDKTQADVETRLASLDTEVDDAFKQGADQAQKAFEDYVDARMEDYKKERYSGVLGWGRWLKDKLVGMPPGVEQFYTQGRQLYIAQMDAVIDNVVNIVANGLAEAKSIVTQGKQEISQYVASLPQSLQEVGQETSANIQDKFDQLEQSVNNKQDELITGLAQRYQDSVGQVDAKIEKLKAANRGLVDKAIAAVAGTIATILKLKDLLLGVLSKAAGVISFIINDPIKFLGNLVSGVKLGFNNFVAKIGGYLEKGMIGWLTGAVASAGIDMPEKLDLPGIFSLVMQILGLTYQNVRGMAVKILGESVVGFLETTFDVFKTLATEGIAGLWGFIQDKIGDLKTMVMDQIKDMLIVQVIKAGAKWILSMLNPAAAFIKACMAIYDIVKFFIERGSEMIGLVNAIVDSVSAVAKGNIAGAAKMVEESLGKAVPVAIGFLANLLGLGGIADKVRAIIETVQKPIMKAVGWVLTKAKAFAKKMGRKLGIVKDEGDEKGEAGAEGETDAPEGVKARAGGELSQRLKGGVDNPRELQAAVSTVYNKYQPEGLKYLDVVEVPDKPGVFEVMASASKEERVATVYTTIGLEVKDLLSLVGKSGWGKTSLTAAMMIEGKPAVNLGQWESAEKEEGRNAEHHAEQEFLIDLEDEWEDITDKHDKQKEHLIVINLTRSPCADCSRVLVKFKNKKKDAGWNVAFHIRMLSIYGGEKRGSGGEEAGAPQLNYPGSEIALSELVREGFGLEPLDVLGWLKQKGVDLDMTPELQAKLQAKIQQVERQLEAFETADAGKK